MNFVELRGTSGCAGWHPAGTKKSGFQAFARTCSSAVLWTWDFRLLRSNPHQCILANPHQHRGLDEFTHSRSSSDSQNYIWSVHKVSPRGTIAAKFEKTHIPRITEGQVAKWRPQINVSNHEFPIIGQMKGEACTTRHQGSCIRNCSAMLTSWIKQRRNVLPTYSPFPLREKFLWEDDIPFPRCHDGYCQGICVPVCISSSTMWPARTEIGTEPAQRRPHMCDCDGAHIMHTKLSQPQNCHKPRRKRSKRTQSVQVIQPSPVAQQGCAQGAGLNLPHHPLIFIRCEYYTNSCGDGNLD